MNDTWGNYLCRASGERYEKIHLRLMPPQRNNRLVKIRLLYPNITVRVTIRVPKNDDIPKIVETVKPIVTGDGEENLLTYERESLTGRNSDVTKKSSFMLTLRLQKSNS